MNDEEMVATCYGIAESVFELIRLEKKSDRFISMDDWRNPEKSGGVNPYWNQTGRGLFLECYYGLPNKLWTPLGQWNFGGSGSGRFDSVESGIVRLTRATVHVAGHYNPNIGEIGPIYALHSWMGKDLPDPIERNKSEYIESSQANLRWDKCVSSLGFKF
jgi:hypothetical protein